MIDWMKHDKPSRPIEGWHTMTPEEHMTYFLCGFFVLVIFLLRNTSFGFLWKAFKTFMLVLLATILIDYVKKDVKDWWNKD